MTSTLSRFRHDLPSLCLDRVGAFAPSHGCQNRPILLRYFGRDIDDFGWPQAELRQRADVSLPDHPSRAPYDQSADRLSVRHPDRSGRQKDRRGRPPGSRSTNRRIVSIALRTTPGLKLMQSMASIDHPRAAGRRGRRAPRSSRQATPERKTGRSVPLNELRGQDTMAPPVDRHRELFRTQASDRPSVPDRPPVRQQR